MNIGLYFGSFNPLHLGHLIIAEQALKVPQLDEVWFVVSPHNPFKNENQLLNARQRLHMVRLALEDTHHLKVSDIEFQLPKPSYTSNTLSYLVEKYPQHNFKILMGSDGFKNIKKWHNASYIIENFEILVYVRPNEIPEKMEGVTFQCVEGPLLEISSSFIRNEIMMNRSIRFLVHDAVREEIENNNYYKKI